MLMTIVAWIMLQPIVIAAWFHLTRPTRVVGREDGTADGVTSTTNEVG